MREVLVRTKRIICYPWEEWARPAVRHICWWIMCHTEEATRFETDGKALKVTSGPYKGMVRRIVDHEGGITTVDPPFPGDMW